MLCKYSSLSEAQLRVKPGMTGVRICVLPSNLIDVCKFITHLGAKMKVVLMSLMTEAFHKDVMSSTISVA